MTSRPKTSKLLLVADPRFDGRGAPAPALRRYRIARLRLDPRAGSADSRFEYLKRVYD